MTRFFRRYWLALAIPTVFLAVWAVMLSVRPTRAAVNTTLVFQDLLLPTRFSPARLLHDEPSRNVVSVYAPKGRGEVPADVYVPAGGGRHAAILISVGAADKIRDNPGVIRFARAFARQGIVVMVPQLYYPFPQKTLPDQVQQLVGAFGTNIEEIIASYQWLSQQPYVDPKRIGIFGVSAGGGVGLIAASDARIRNDVDFFAALGSYFDMTDLISAMASDSISYNGVTTPWHPQIHSLRVLYRSIISYLPDSIDRDILTRIYLDNDERARSETGRLTETGRQIYDAFEQKDSKRILSFWRDVSPKDVDTLGRISPSGYVSNLHAELFIMTDRGDPYIPYVESRRLRDATSRNGHITHYAEFDFIDHVEPRIPHNPFALVTDLVKVTFYTWLIMLRMQ